MKKHLFALVLALTLCLCIFPLQVFAEPESVTINVYNWGQYISDGTDGYADIIEEFETAFPHIKVNYMTFDSNESMYTKLTAGGSSFDVIVPSDYMVEMLIAEDMLEPLNFENIPNFEGVQDSAKNPAYDPENRYSVPYTLGSVGLIYNQKYVKEEDVARQSWDLLWDEDYKGKILMFDNPRDSFAIAELLLGYSINTQDPAELDAAADLLRQQKPLVQNYVMDQIYDKMQREEAWIAPYYAGDYLVMVEENPDLCFYHPKEGYNSFADALCIPKGSQHKEEAEIFINFLLDPEICGQNLEYIGYTAPVPEAKNYMDEEVANDPVSYPDEETQKRGYVFQALSLEGTQYMNLQWLTVKTSGAETTLYLVLTIVALVLVAVLWVFFKVRKRRQKARRCRKWKI